LQVTPQESALNSVAWIRATCSEDALRNGRRAVEEAIKACELTHWNQGACIDTLAAAYAESGDFDQAIRYEQQTLEITDEKDPRRKNLQQRLALYKEHKPFREEPTER
jgi:cytochrome c-type biogenesis protein CcmH/NrfG